MPKKGTNYREIEERLAFASDGLPTRPTHDWTRHKLALIAYYLRGFAPLCDDKAGGWYYLDGFAGNGANDTPGFPTARGSALVGISQLPPPQHAILIERERANIDILKQRCARYNFTTVIEGDCNTELPKALPAFANRWLPGFCVLDPEGLELHWDTVVACSRWRRGDAPYEQLIYFSTPGAARTAGVQQAGWSEAAERRLTSLFGNTDWKPIAELQRSGALEPGEAGQRYQQLYTEQLTDLGYSTVMSRPAISRTGTLVYHLVFATANQAGASIMQQAMVRAYSGQLPFQM